MRDGGEGWSGVKGWTEAPETTAVPRAQDTSRDGTGTGETGGVGRGPSRVRRRCRTVSSRRRPLGEDWNDPLCLNPASGVTIVVYFVAPDPQRVVRSPHTEAQTVVERTSRGEE